MKIADLKTYVVANPPPHYGGLYWVFLKLVTDGGVEGFGEVYSVPFQPDTVARMIEDVGERYVLGSDPFKIERLWRLIYSSGYTQRSDLSIMGVLSGIEMACWDIVGKELDKPVYELLGGQVHERLRSYTYIYPGTPGDTRAYTDPDVAAERAAIYADLGFTALKFDPVGPYTAFDPRQLSLDALDNAERIATRVREAVGSRCDLLIGTHGQMTASGAIRLARRLEKLDPLWLEEPVPPENVGGDGAGRPRRPASRSRPASGSRPSTSSRACSTGRRPRSCRWRSGASGGILEAKKIAGMAEAHYAQIAPHLYCGPIEGAANIQLDACSPNFLIQESIETWGGFHAEILKEPVRWEEGYIIPPTRPGLGVELNEEVAAAHPYSGTKLHLEMHERPL